MNPDPTSPEYARVVREQAAKQRAERIRKADLHRRAVARRRKAKRGGRR